MRKMALLSLPLLVWSVHTQASPMVSYSEFLPPPSDIFAPTPTYTSNGFAMTVSPGDPQGITYVGLTQSYPNIARSPFEGVSGYENVAYDAVTGGGSACFGTCGGLEEASFREAAVGSGPKYSFIYGSPDTYNTLTLYSNTGVFTFTGSDLTNPNTPSQMGYEFVTISGVGNVYGAQVASSQNSFEFAAVSTVPLPASAPMFGAALMALGAVGYSLKRKTASAA